MFYLYTYMKELIKECKYHGQTNFTLENRGYFRCKKCRVEAVTKRRKLLKIKSLKYKGFKCEKCGYDKCSSSLVFHHLDPTKKDFGISSKGLIKSWEKVKVELDKCILLCANCHGEEHEKLDKQTCFNSSVEYSSDTGKVESSILSSRTK